MNNYLPKLCPCPNIFCKHLREVAAAQVLAQRNAQAIMMTEEQIVLESLTPVSTTKLFYGEIRRRGYAIPPLTELP